MRAAVLVHRIGPYHAARLAAAGRRGTVVAVELSARSHEYAWDAVETPAGFRRVTVCPDDAAVGRRELAARLLAVLADLRPGAVFVNGWSGGAAAAAARWCGANRVPAVVMSESAAGDEPRRAWREWVKRQVVRGFSAALVGGTRHREYAVALGVPADRVFDGYDAVDNDHFAGGADRARADSAAVRRRLGLPERYFLASNRFVPKKNLTGLLRAFAAYRRAAGAGGWDLVLLGDGPLRGEVEAEVAAAGLTGAVRLPGFRQYDELPAYYGLAGAFVHASSTEQWGLVVNEAMAAGLPVLVSDRCGCAPDLVRDGDTGFTFPPDDPARLAALMARVAADHAGRDRMGRAAREWVGRWSPERFADGFWAAAAAAAAAPPPASNRLVLRLLSP